MNGFRIDHVLLTKELTNFVSKVCYDHTTHEVMSDHSSLHVDIKIKSRLRNLNLNRIGGQVESCAFDKSSKDTL